MLQAAQSFVRVTSPFTSDGTAGSGASTPRCQLLRVQENVDLGLPRT